MEFIIHRVNLIENLKKTPQEYGCEIDIRSDGSKLILNHDPFTKGDYLIDYLDEYKNGTLVLNIKESGIEDVVLKEVRLRNIKSYFLLDVEFPYLFSSSKKGERNIAIRFSEMEPIENFNLFKSKFDWIWIDTISRFPVTSQNKHFFKNHKACLVCPSRWGRNKDIHLYKNLFIERGYTPNFILTKLNLINQWRF